MGKNTICMHPRSFEENKAMWIFNRLKRLFTEYSLQLKIIEDNPDEEELEKCRFLLKASQEAIILISALKDADFYKKKSKDAVDYYQLIYHYYVEGKTNDLAYYSNRTNNEYSYHYPTTTFKEDIAFSAHIVNMELDFSPNRYKYITDYMDVAQ